jgi:hypothetical protein
MYGTSALFMAIHALVRCRAGLLLGVAAAAKFVRRILAGVASGWHALHPYFSPWTLWFKVTSPFFAFRVTVSAASTGTATNNSNTTTATIFFMDTSSFRMV